MLPPVQQKASTRHNCVSRARHTHGAAHTAAGLSCQPLGAPKLAQHTSHQPRRRRGAAHTAAGLSCTSCESQSLTHTHTAEGKKSQVPCLAIDVYWHTGARTWLRRCHIVVPLPLSLVEPGRSRPGRTKYRGTLGVILRHTAAYKCNCGHGLRHATVRPLYTFSRSPRRAATS